MKVSTEAVYFGVPIRLGRVILSLKVLGLVVANCFFFDVGSAVAARINYSHSFLFDSAHNDSIPKSQLFSSGVDLGILGTSINAEWNAGNKLGVRADIGYVGAIIGIKSFIEEGSFGHSTFLLLRTNMGLEPRYYYNRGSNLRKTEKMNPRYFSLRLQYNSPVLLSTIEESSPSYIERAYQESPRSFQSLDLIPTWGFKLGKRSLQFDFNFGYILHFRNVFKNEAIVDSPRVRLLARLLFCLK